MKIQKATEKHTLDIVEFQVAMAKETENLSLHPRTVLKGVKTVFSHPEIGYYLIAIIEDKVVACTLILFEWSDWRAKTVLWIHSLYVLPKFRKQGIFKALYNHLKGLVDNSDEFAGIRLYVDKNNTNAQNKYIAAGMRSDHYNLFEWLKP